MFQSIRRRATQSLIAAVMAAGLPMAAYGGTINIFLSDMDVMYMGSTHALDPDPDGSLYDAMGGHSGGSLAEATADVISTAVFERDNVVLGTLINTAADGDDLHADLHIDGIGPTITKGVFLPSVGSNGDNFGLDFFVETGAGVKLRITTDNVSLRVTDNVFQFDGEGTVVDQSLPFGILPLQPTVHFSYTATLPAVPTTSVISMATGSGALTISGVEVPEPATVMLSLLGGIASLALLRQRRMI
jgi:PEP-CTERM motif